MGILTPTKFKTCECGCSNFFKQQVINIEESASTISIRDFRNIYVCTSCGKQYKLEDFKKKK